MKYRELLVLPDWALQSGWHRQWLYGYGVVRSTESSQARKNTLYVV